MAKPLRARLEQLLAVSTMSGAGGFFACGSPSGSVSTSSMDAQSDAPTGLHSGVDAATSDAFPSDARTNDNANESAAATDATGTTDAAGTMDATAADAYVSSTACSQTADDAGSAPVLIASGQGRPQGIAVDATRTYWANTADGTVVSCPLAGCPPAGPTVLASGQNSPNLLVVDTTSVYWVNLFATIQKCPLSGCGSSPPTVYAAGSTTATGLAIDQTNIYWTEIRNGIVASCPLAGCATKNILYAGPNGPSYGVAVDSSNIYWTNIYTGTVNKAPLTGVPDGGSPAIIAASSAGTAFLAIDSVNAYWTNEYGHDYEVAGPSSICFPVRRRQRRGPQRVAAFDYPCSRHIPESVGGP